MATKSEGITFEEWKKEAFDCLHEGARKAGMNEDAWDWILADTEQIKIDGYDRGVDPCNYVTYQVECAQ